MWKILILTILTILIIGCDPTMATKYNTATATDTDGTKFVSAADLDRKGLIQASLTNWATTAKPNVAQESVVENGGAGFKTDTVGGDSISLVDPDTALTVADGDVYIVLNGDSGDAGYGDYSFTATVPTWSDSKQGYYLTGLFVDYRVVGGCVLNSGIYNQKYIQQGRDNKVYSKSLIESLETITAEASTSSAYYVDASPTFADSIEVEAGDIFEVVVAIAARMASTGTYRYQIVSTGTCVFNSHQDDSNINAFEPTVNTNEIGYFIRHGGTIRRVIFSRKIYIQTRGTLKFKEQFGTEGSGTAYISYRNLYIKKFNEFKLTP